jgi:hypothetical protein
MTPWVPEMTLVLVGGHESGAGEQLGPWVESGHAFRAVGTGRALAEAVEAALAHTDRPVCVVPMTLGRDHELVDASPSPSPSAPRSISSAGCAPPPDATPRPTTAPRCW